ncbi:MAG: FHA domain-containing protein [Anaerolineae bacterium]|nr:FHA domain-containing protein [Anaerolineae bacterium]
MMVYGRLDIYWPDGPIESYRLDKPTIGVGRSTGNDIVLDTTAVSRYHITVSLREQQVILEDLESVNGTYVDGVRLPAQEQYVLRGGEEIQMGDIRLIFHPAAELEEAASDTTQRVVLSQQTYRVELEGPDSGVAPGAYVQASLKIKNLSDEIDRYFIEVEGLPKGWVRVDRVEMEVDPMTEGQAMISFKPLRTSASVPGSHPFIVRVRSKLTPNETIEIPTQLTVLPFSGYGMALDTDVIKDGHEFKLYIHNQGNAPLPISIQGVSQAQKLRFELPQATFTLGPGERQTLAGTVGPRRPRMLGQEHTYEFALVARSHDAAGFLASVPGTYIERGMLPTWLPVLAIPVFALIVLMLLGFSLLLLGGDDTSHDPTVEPTITTFAVAEPAVTLGEPILLSWNVIEAESIEIILSHGSTEQPLDIEPDDISTSFTLDQTGIFTLTLYAHNGQSVSSAAATVEVHPSVALSLEVLDPTEPPRTELVRYVTRDVRIRWEVLGATEANGGYAIWFENSDANVTLPAAPLALEGEYEAKVTPGETVDEWLVTLYSEGQDGVIGSVTQKLTIAYPGCELSAARTLVRSGPGEHYPAIVPPLESSLEGNPSLSPVARNANGDWMQVVIGIGDNARQGWVLRDDFTCTNFDPEHLVITDDYPPPPVTPSPSPTNTSEPAGDDNPSPSTTPSPTQVPPTATKTVTAD